MAGTCSESMSSERVTEPQSCSRLGHTGHSFLGALGLGQILFSLQLSSVLTSSPIRRAEVRGQQCRTVSHFSNPQRFKIQLLLRSNLPSH